MKYPDRGNERAIYVVTARAKTEAYFSAGLSAEKSLHKITPSTWIDPWLRPAQCLHQAIDLIVVPSVRKGQQFVDELLHPAVVRFHVANMNTSSQKEWQHQGGPFDLAMFGLVVETAQLGFLHILD